MSDIKNVKRRDFIKVVSAGFAASTLALSGCDSDNTVENSAQFAHGVASGDPLSDRVVIWTRATPQKDEPVKIGWEIAEDTQFKKMVGSGEVETSADRDYTIKVDAGNLSPATTYYYRFRSGDTVSVVGNTKTLPTGTTSQVKLAVFSCANYPAGHFNVYKEAAGRNDLDAVIHLGDYIYEYGMKDGDGKPAYASANAEALGRVSSPTTELLSLADYRQRYAQYRSDEDLQALHAALPFINVWDDHEIANDGWKDGAENHDPATEGAFSDRKAAAMQAFLEWLPIRDSDNVRDQKIYRSFDFGDLVSLHMLDTRFAGRDKQLEYANYLDAATGAFDAARFQADLTDSGRQLLGAEQTAWLQSGMAQSTATWQVLGQQILMGRMEIPSPLLLPDPLNPQISFTAYAGLVAKAQTAPETLTAAEQQILAAPSIAYNLDAWDGYFVQRETVLGTAIQQDKNLVVLSGDTHNAWANDLKTLDGAQAGVEFATASVSSPGLEEILTQEDPAVLAGGLTQLIAPLQFANTVDRGYVVVTFTPSEAVSEWIFVDTISSKNYQLATGKGKTLKTLPGAGNRKIVSV